MEAGRNTTIDARETAPMWWVGSALGDWCVIAGGAYVVMQAVRIGQADPAPLTLVSCALALLAAWLLIGARQHALAILGHDGAHGLLCRNLTVNDFLVRVLAFAPLGAFLGGYRDFHFAHHRWTATERDPELRLKQRASGSYVLPRSRGRMIQTFVADLCGGGLRETFDLIVVTKKGAGRLEMLGPILWWAVVGGGLYLVSPGYAMSLVGGWFFCIGTSFWALFRLRVYTEHLGTHGTHVISARFWERTLFLPHNTWCHFEHHAHSHVSASRLPRLREQETLATHQPVTVSRLFAEFAQPAGGGDICLTRRGEQKKSPG